MARLRSLHSWNTLSEEVLCVCICREPRVLTGHESKLRIWSWNIQLKKSEQIAEVEVKGDVTCICQFVHTPAFAVSVGEELLIYNYEEVGGTMSLSMSNQMHFNSDEINQIDIHPTKQSLVCCCDDSGDIKVIDIESRKILHTLTGFHDGICSAVKFCSKKPWELVSGGLDCTIGRWDFNRGRLLAKLSTRQDSSGAALIFNPPMVHCLDVFSEQRSLVCGLGDGRLVLYSMNAPKDISFKCEVHPHLASVACVRCIELRESSCQSTAVSTTLYVASVGNEGVMCVHKLNQSGAKEKPALLFVGKVDCTSKANHVDISYENEHTEVLIFTADVAGSVSVFIFQP
jgi:WD40 repeat protein